MIEVEAVTKTYDPMPRAMRLLLRTQVRQPVNALRETSLRLEPGETCVVIGPNGAGKSTLFRICTGLTTPSSGRVTVNGHDSIKDGRRARAHIGFAPAEERTLLMRHSVRENLSFQGAMRGMSGAHLAKEIELALESVGLSALADRTVFAISTGMRARLQLARAILGNPPVLVLDEPTSAIDPVAARDILKIVLDVARARGTAVLLSSHRLEEIETLGERMILLDEGKTVYQGGLESFLSEHAGDSVELEFQDPGAASDALDLLSAGNDWRVVASHEDPHRIVVTGTTEVGAVLGTLNTTDRLVSVNPFRPTLLDVLATTWGDAK